LSHTVPSILLLADFPKLITFAAAASGSGGAP
jgi:hypothetical protein